MSSIKSSTEELFLSLSKQKINQTPNPEIRNIKNACHVAAGIWKASLNADVAKTSAIATIKLAGVCQAFESSMHFTCDKSTSFNLSLVILISSWEVFSCTSSTRTVARIFSSLILATQHHLIRNSARPLIFIYRCKKRDILTSIGRCKNNRTSQSMSSSRIEIPENK